MEEDINKLAKKLKSFIISDFPSNDLEQEIFAELDVIDASLYGQLTNKKKYSPFDLKYEKECVQRIEKYIKQRGEKEFKKNKILFEWYQLCLEAIKLMEEYNKQNE